VKEHLGSRLDSGDSEIYRQLPDLNLCEFQNSDLTDLEKFCPGASPDTAEAVRARRRGEQHRQVAITQFAIEAELQRNPVPSNPYENAVVRTRGRRHG